LTTADAQNVLLLLSVLVLLERKCSDVDVTKLQLKYLLSLTNSVLCLVYITEQWGVDDVIRHVPVDYSSALPNDVNRHDCLK